MLTDRIVQTRAGAVLGVCENGVHKFLGIPYAAPPFGPHRMRPPAPVVAWEGVRRCMEYGPTVPKLPYRAPFDQLLPEPEIAGEGCLNLNVWTADPSGNSQLPVLVWIHGGAFTNGSGAVPEYDGTSFARDGVVCVTINYRLGADGFLFLDDGIANVGLLDQIAALTWVRDNIASFGGDPDRVTIAGESAGAMSVASLMSMPLAEGLFRSAIAQSGAGHHATTAPTATFVARDLAGRLGVPATREAIAGVPIGTLLSAQQQLIDELRMVPDPSRWRELALNGMPFEPVIDGDVLPALPIDRLRAGASADIRVMIGTNTDEHRFFLVPTGALGMISETVLGFVADAYGLSCADLRKYQARTGSNPGDVLAALSTDWFFRVPALRVAEARNSSRTWVYEFGWPTPVLGGQLGACHALEIAFAFDTLGAEGAMWLRGDRPPQSLADTMHSAWVRFITDGDPGWPTYTLDSRMTMLFAERPQVVEDLRSEERILWDGRR